MEEERKGGEEKRDGGCEEKKVQEEGGKGEGRRKGGVEKKRGRTTGNSVERCSDGRSRCLLQRNLTPCNYAFLFLFLLFLLET